MKVCWPSSRILTTMVGVTFAALVFFGTNQTCAGGFGSPSESRTVEQIRGYCAASWRNAQIPKAEWSDCTQQVFAEVLGKVPRNRLGMALAQAGSPERRELNRCIWRIIQRWLRSVRHVSLRLSDHLDRCTTQRCPSDTGDFESVMAMATEKLSPRQVRILSYLRDGHSIREVAQVMGIPAPRVSDEKYRAIQKLRRHFG